MSSAPVRGPDTAGSLRAAGRWERCLRVAVAVLGAAVLAVGRHEFVTFGVHLQLTVLAAVLAAVGLLPRQDARGWIVVALAVTGLSVVVVLWVDSPPGSTLSVVVALCAVQALAALVALLLESTVVEPAVPEEKSPQEAYEHLIEAYRDYQACAARYQQQPAGQQTAAGQAAAHAGADATVSGRQSLAALEARYIQHGGVASTVRTVGSAPGAATAAVTGDPGVPGINRGTPPAPGISDGNRPRERTSPSVWP
ncbi:DUF5336 domain-containing protein [Mycolicibacterium sp.]|uniref:DUF5336 domain-containing protein n=1 Tax=Mycolicibacterium sp. TaxID=2320850 RepID=UPI003D0A8972